MVCMYPLLLLYSIRINLNVLRNDATIASQRMPYLKKIGTENHQIRNYSHKVLAKCSIRSKGLANKKQPILTPWSLPTVFRRHSLPRVIDILSCTMCGAVCVCVCVSVCECVCYYRCSSRVHHRQRILSHKLKTGDRMMMSLYSYYGTHTTNTTQRIFSSK